MLIEMFNTNAVIFVGWMIIWRQQNNALLRQEQRDEFDRYRNELADIIHCANRYHMDEQASEIDAQAIKVRVSRIISDIQNASWVRQGDAGLLLVGFRQGITLKNFDTTEHRALGSGDVQLEEMRYALDDLSDFLSSQWRSNTRALDKFPWCLLLMSASFIFVVNAALVMVKINGLIN